MAKCYRKPLASGDSSRPMTSSRETGVFKVYDQTTQDFDALNSFDAEIIEISSPPIKIYKFNLLKTLETMPNNTSPMDELYAEIDIMDENKLFQLYNEGLPKDHKWQPDEIFEGEIFDPYVLVPGFYQEPTWTQELSRLGIEDTEEELSITFNYQAMLEKLGKEIRIGDLIQTFRGKLYRVMDAYVADETIGWKYIHFHVICRKPKDLDRLKLPEGSQEIPRTSNG